MKNTSNMDLPILVTLARNRDMFPPVGSKAFEGIRQKLLDKVTTKEAQAIIDAILDEDNKTIDASIKEKASVIFKIARGA